ncbi:MAG: pyridoxal-phosphate dependent enzyme, partial [bacterium]
YIDEIYTVTDKESFNMARRISREEGIFVGGSSGTAACAALKLAKNLPQDRVVVVIFPDTGERYLSKFYSDEWMKENRFLDIEKVSLKRVVEVKSSQLPPVISVSPQDSVRAALEKMKQYNISQLPVIVNDKCVGSLEEGVVMGQVIENNTLIESPVKDVMQECFPVISHSACIEDAKNLFSRGYAAVLIEELGKIVGIITKYDLLEFIAS